MEFEYSDTIAMTCLLCARQFKSLEQLKRHNKESDLHKVVSLLMSQSLAYVYVFPHPCLLINMDVGPQKNFRDANLREIARQKVAAIRKGQCDVDPPKYRDRASERRIMHNQPEIPMPENNGAVAKKKRHIEGPPPPPSPPPPSVAPAQDDANVGNKLLKMMGWKEGSGLGTDGDGRVDPM